MSKLKSNEKSEAIDLSFSPSVPLDVSSWNNRLDDDNNDTVTNSVGNVFSSPEEMRFMVRDDNKNSKNTNQI